MEVLVALCQIYFKQDSVQKAKQAIAQCVKQFGTYTRGLFAMATLGLLVREAVVTNAAIEQAVRAVGPIPEVYYIQAVQYLLQGNTAMAQVQLVKAVHQHPHLRDTWTKLGQLLVSHSHSQAVASQAELCAEAGTVIVPFPVPRLSEADRASSWLLARSKLAYGKLEEAVNLLQRQVRMYPSTTIHWFYLAVALYFKALHAQADPTDQVISILTHMIKGNAVHSVAFLGRIALSDTHLLNHQRSEQKTEGQISTALKLAKEAIEIATSDSEKAIATRQQARCSLEAGKVAEAVELYKASLKLDSSVAYVWQELGAIYDTNNQLAAAELTLKTGNAKTPHHHLSSTLNLAHHHYTYTLNYRAGLDLLKDAHKKYATINPSPLPSLFQGAFLTLLADPKQQNAAVQALTRAHDYAATKGDATLTAYFTDILNADKSSMAESKKVEAKVHAKQKFWTEAGL